MVARLHRYLLVPAFLCGGLLAAASLMAPPAQAGLAPSHACRASLLAFPKIINQVGEHRTEMFNPGGNHQFVVVSLEVPAADPSCTQFKGTGMARVQMHSQDNPRDIITLGAFPYGINQGGEQGGVLSQSASSTADDYACGKGQRVNRVWISFTSKLKTLGGRVIATKRGRKNIEIEGHGYGC